MAEELLEEKAVEKPKRGRPPKGENEEGVGQSPEYLDRLSQLAAEILEKRRILFGVDTREDLNTHLVGLSEQSLRQWETKQVRNPQPSSLDSLRRNLQLSEATLLSYLERGDITLEDLWKRRGEERYVVLGVVTKETTVADFGCLNLEDQLIAFDRMFRIISEQVIEKKNSLPVKLIAFTTTGEIARLHKLIETSHYYRGTTNDDLFKSGVDRELMTGIADRVPVLRFSAPVWETLLPFLIRPVSWTRDVPVPAPDLATLEGDIEAFEGAIRI